MRASVGTLGEARRCRIGVGLRQLSGSDTPRPSARWHAQDPAQGSQIQMPQGQSKECLRERSGVTPRKQGLCRGGQTAQGPPQLEASNGKLVCAVLQAKRKYAYGLTCSRQLGPTLPSVCVGGCER